MHYLVTKRRSKFSLIIVILLFTLLLHILLLYFFTTVQFSYSDKFSELIQSLFSNEKQEEKTAQNQLTHSAPVIFQDDPQDNQAQPKPVAQSIPEPPQTLVAHSSNPLVKKPVEQKEEPPKSLMPQMKEEKKDAVRNPSQAQGERVIKNNSPLYDNDSISTVRPEPAKDRAATRERSQKKLENTMLAELEEKTLDQTVHPEVLEGQVNNSSEKYGKENYALRAPQGERRKNQSSDHPSSQASKSLSLADLGKKYMQKVSASIDTGGYGAMNVQGSSYGHPSAYQIALERYVGKMCKEIETAYKINTNHSIQATQHKPFNLLVELNSNGSIHNIYPLESSGIARIDEFAMSVFKAASKSFPKLPDAMGNHFRIQFGINHIDHMAYLSKGGTLSMH